MTSAACSSLVDELLGSGGVVHSGDCHVNALVSVRRELHHLHKLEKIQHGASCRVLTIAGRTCGRWSLGGRRTDKLSRAVR
jgi:hypothetical protein